MLPQSFRPSLIASGSKNTPSWACPPFINFVNGDASHGFDGKLAALRTRLAGMNTHLAQVAKDTTGDSEALSTKASSDFKAAIEKSKPLAFFIQGDLNYSAGDAGKAEALVTDLSKARETASTSANATLDKMRCHEAAVSLVNPILGRHWMKFAVRTNPGRQLLGVEHGLEAGC